MSRISSEELRERVADLREWALSRIEHCRREEDKFARVHAPGPYAINSTMLRAVQERQTLQAVLRLLDEGM